MENWDLVCSTPKLVFSIMYFHCIGDVVDGCVSAVYSLRNSTRHLANLITISDVFILHLFLTVYFKDFSNWIITRLLRIAATPSCHMLHKKICDVICSLLFLFKSKSPAIFGVLTKELLHLFEDLLSLHKSNAGGQSVEWPVVVGRFLSQFDEHVEYLQPAPLQVVNMQNLECIEVTLLTVLIRVTAVVFFRRQELRLWQIGCALLEYGSPKIKSLAISFLTELFELGGLPAQLASTFFGSFLELLKHLVDMDTDQLKLYEEPLSRLIKTLFPCEADAYRHIEPIYLTMLLEDLCMLFADGLLTRLRSTALRAALCHLLHFLQCRPAGGELASQVRSGYVHRICRALVDELGRQADAEVRVRLCPRG